MGIFDFFKKKENENPTEPKDAVNQGQLDDFTKDMVKSADFFVSSSADRFKGLDFSTKSLEIVENVLEEASDFYDEMNKEQKQNLISTVGA